jgi:phage tail-like protein
MADTDNRSGGKFSRNDPLRDFKFKVQIIPNDKDLGDAVKGIGELGFAVVSGIAVQNEMIPYREGGMNTHPHKMVGQSDFTPVTFSRGVFSRQGHLWRWQTFMHSWMQSSGARSSITDGGAGKGSKGTSTDYRCRVDVRVYDHPHTHSSAKYAVDPANPSTDVDPGIVRLKFTLYNAWPGGFALSDLNAGASSIMVQQMTLHHEGFEIDWNPDQTNAITTA